MKKTIALFLLFACILGGCGQETVVQEGTSTVTPTKETTQETAPTPTAEVSSNVQSTVGGSPSPTVALGQETEDGVFVYEHSIRTECFAVDEEGLLYTITRYSTLYKGYTIKIHDLEGNCIEEHSFDFGLETEEGKKAELAKHLLVGENYLYVIVPESDCANVLYQIDRTTWEAKRLYDFAEFENVFDVVLLEDSVYILAEYENYEEKEFADFKNWYVLEHNGRDYAVAYLDGNEETPKLNFVLFDLPMCIFAIDEKTLGIYGRDGNEGEVNYRLFAYSPKDNTIQAMSDAYDWKGEGSLHRPFQYYENGFFMVSKNKNIYYVSLDGTKKGLLSTSNVFYSRLHTLSDDSFNRKIIYANGYLFYEEYHPKNTLRNYMERIKIEDKLDTIFS